MRRKDEILNQPYSDKGAYKVPEGYFDSLANRIMSQIPEEQAGPQLKPAPAKQSIFARTSVRLAIAAAIAAAAIATTTVHLQRQTADTLAPAMAANTLSDGSAYTEEYVTEAMEYAMIDGDDMFYYMSDQ